MVLPLGSVSSLFLSCVCVCVCVLTQSRLTLFDPMDCSLPVSSIHGIFPARILEWVAISSSSGSSQPRIKPPSSESPARASGFFFFFFYHWASWEAFLCPRIDWKDLSHWTFCRLFHGSTTSVNKCGKYLGSLDQTYLFQRMGDKSYEE